MVKQCADTVNWQRKMYCLHKFEKHGCKQIQLNCFCFPLTTKRKDILMNDLKIPGCLQYICCNSKIVGYLSAIYIFFFIF